MLIKTNTTIHNNIKLLLKTNGTLQIYNERTDAVKTLDQ